VNPNLTVDQATLARIFSVSQRTVQRWEAEGLRESRVADKATAVAYDLPSAVAWLVDRAEGDASSVREEYAMARTRKATVDALLREDELAARRGELVPIDRVAGMVREPLEKVDVKLRTAVRRHSRDWATRLGVSHAEAMAMMTGIIEEVRADLREVFEG
jgi:phage terminase Nu1 subunit (DNA packaging protein)